MSQKMMIRLFVFAMMVVISVGCATRQDVLSLNDSLLVLEKRAADLQKQTNQLKTGLNQQAALQTQQAQQATQSKNQFQEEQKRMREASAAMNVDVARLAEELRALRGEVDQSTYQLQGNQKKIDNTVQAQLAKTQQSNIAEIKRLEGRLAQIENYLNLELQKGTPPGPGNKAVNKTGLSKMSVDQLYRSGKQTFDQGNYEEARERFQYLIKNHPTSKDADNAQFWIGEIYYREKWYEKAILEYQQVIEKYPKGNKVRASLLKQGFAFYKLKDSANARLILRELIKKYPSSSEARIAAKKLKESN